MAAKKRGSETKANVRARRESIKRIFRLGAKLGGALVSTADREFDKLLDSVEASLQKALKKVSAGDKK
ncbi:MAG TPA: hypothetical protein VJL09_03170 [Candidatus Paceibacterota bacterium]